MSENEEYVRANWEDAYICSWGQLAFWWLLANGLGPLCQSVYGSESEAWAAAAEFTRERREQIQQLEEEIGVVRYKITTFRRHEWEESKDAWSRILARLKSALADLKRGMVVSD